MGGVYEAYRLNGLRCHDVYTKFHKDWLIHSKVNMGGGEMHRQHGDFISLLLFFQNKESGLKMAPTRMR
jgi:hypothetical protein